MDETDRNFIREKIAIADSWFLFWNRAGGSCVQGFWDGYRKSLKALLDDNPTHHAKPPKQHPHDIEPEMDDNDG